MYEQEGGRVASSAKPSPIVSITMRTPLVETALVWIKLSRTNHASRVIVVRSIRLAGSTQDPRITNQFVDSRSPYPITWQEQDALFRRLPAHLARMALFAVNTGLRDANVCGLQWQWEVVVPEVGRAVFVIPPEAFKTKRPHVVILNDVAWSIIEAQRGKHPIWVSPTAAGVLEP